ncbi:hypothetical protein C2E23DRAFT_34509 [Lenzites betulinus]|nr:hypothetical protein C2E23DRAFT_34509 [Lenzites betulinus]
MRLPISTKRVRVVVRARVRVGEEELLRGGPRPVREGKSERGGGEKETGRREEGGNSTQRWPNRSPRPSPLIYLCDRVTLPLPPVARARVRHALLPPTTNRSLLRPSHIKVGHKARPHPARPRTPLRARTVLPEDYPGRPSGA